MDSVRHLKRLLIVLLFTISPVFIAGLFFSSVPCKKNSDFVEQWAGVLNSSGSCRYKENLKVDLTDLSSKILGGCIDQAQLGRDPQAVCRELLDRFDDLYPPSIAKARWVCREEGYDRHLVETLCTQSLSPPLWHFRF